jgi:hypothetical protein
VSHPENIDLSFEEMLRHFGTMIKKVDTDEPYTVEEWAAFRMMHEAFQRIEREDKKDD